MSILQPQDIVTLFTSDQCQLYGKQQFDDYIYAYRFAVLTGLRPGELRGLQWSDINGSRITIQRAINAHDEVTHGKNQNAIRSFDLSGLARDVLHSQKFLSADSLTVFPISSTQNFRKRWEKYCISNGITPVSLYSLRHTFVSVVKTLPEGEVKSLVGHSKSMDTFGVYGHELSGDSQKSAADVEELFKLILSSVV